MSERKPAVLVAGSQTGGKRENFAKFCAELGRELAADHFTIIAGSIKPNTADHHVLRGAGSNRDRGRDETPSVWFIRPTYGQGDVPFEEQLQDLGRFTVRHELYPGSWSDVRTRQVKPADAVVLIGGGAGTLTIAREAQRQSKPILAVPAFGGAARSVFEDLASELAHRWGREFRVRLLSATTALAIVHLIRDWWTAQPAARPAAPDSVATGKADIGFICPLEEELQAVLTRVPTWRLEPPRQDYVQTFYTGEIGAHRVAIASPTSMGRVHAAVTTSDLIRLFMPRYVMLVGIAGGNAAEDVALGDIIVADQIIDYELQKLKRDGPEIRQRSYAIHHRLLSEARALTGWEATIQEARPARGTVTRHVGTMLSGDKVIAVGLKELGAKLFPQIKGVEMEGAGCALACLRFDVGPGFFMVRGVSDLADPDKDREEVGQWRPYACDAAAAFATHLAHRIPLREASDR